MNKTVLAVVVVALLAVGGWVWFHKADNDAAVAPAASTSESTAPAAEAPAAPATGSTTTTTP